MFEVEADVKVDGRRAVHAGLHGPRRLVSGAYQCMSMCSKFVQLFHKQLRYFNTFDASNRSRRGWVPPRLRAWALLLGGSRWRSGTAVGGQAAAHDERDEHGLK